MLRNHFFYVSAFENPSHQSASCFYLANFDGKKSSDFEIFFFISDIICLLLSFYYYLLTCISFYLSLRRFQGCDAFEDAPEK